MRSIRKVPLVACFLGMLLPLWLSCGGGGRSTPPLGTLSVTLVDGPAPDYKEINLNIQKVEIHASANAAENGWITVSEPNRAVDLLKLTNGVVETLAAGRTLDPGRYQQLRLVLGETGNTLKLASGSLVPVEVPSAQKSGIKVPLSFQVALGTTADIWIDFDGAHSIHVKGTGGPALTYVLRPVVHGYEKAVTGGVSGVLTGPGGAPLAGAMVTAQSVDGMGNVTILRSVQTTANGTYTLNLLPLGQSFFVVTQPVIGTASYYPRASSALTLSASNPTLTVNFSFTNPEALVGGANGSITPVAASSQSDTVLLLKAFQSGGADIVLAIASVNSLVNLPAETYAFTAVPAGSYQVQALRRTLNQDGTTTTTRSQTSPSFSVNHGTSTVQNVSFSAPKVSLRIAGGPGGGFADLRIKVTKVEIEGPTGWIPFAESGKVVNLVGALSLGGTETLFTSDDPVPPGFYSRVRVSFGDEIRGTVGFEPARIAPPQPVIVEVPLTFSESQQGLVLVMAPYRSLHWRNGVYIFRPSLQVLQEGQIGRIQGRLTAGGQGVEGGVIAQTFLEPGVPRLLQFVLTDRDGFFKLDLLPIGVPLHVVGLVNRYPTFFEPQASPSVTLGDVPVEWNASFTSPANPSMSLRGSFLPAAASPQTGEVQVLGHLQAGNEIKLFALGIVPTGEGANSEGVLGESFYLGGSPTGSFILRAYRTTWNTDGSFSTLGQNHVGQGEVVDFMRVLNFHW